ncbi:hypothetical protein [Xanthomonas hortorum]|uniref:hypothetical protein n=1 Tax=Xanthomonas hortorum TaxID=56454 RepID=UPI0001FD65B0|nr:hypothetical protein [Xanthomonas hortorum]MCC4627018.1 hypothetical protein [Xanthomonas campestris pv. nigromaculans]APP78591.1 hypothetical protein BJD10_01680 [Xanthomonas hortorum pv. gardneri]EGD21090.1 hypothetical protein XGA_0209 [Xanthomonas hortorum ATCC 19865]KLB10533.1 hypothetical protein SM40611_21990 [Xanthomonas hortorum pv. gardneri]KLB12885.1 hypothetical protein SM23410_01430 [Xanthomonas hortorum pv. gardneri]
MDRCFPEDLEHLRNQIEDLNKVDDPTERVSKLVRIAGDAVSAAFRIAQDSSTLPLQQRALTDLSELHGAIAEAANLLTDPDYFERLISLKGHVPEVMLQHLAVMKIFDKAFYSLFMLMQYDADDRHELDPENGFMITSGSMAYGRASFRPSSIK